MDSCIFSIIYHSGGDSIARVMDGVKCLAINKECTIAATTAAAAAAVILLLLL